MQATLRRLTNMALKTLGPKKAADLDADLMSEAGGFTIDQLMELAGLSVSQADDKIQILMSLFEGEVAVYKVHPPSKGVNVLVACGPGNNGGDGLVAARHLHHYGYKPKIYYPKPTDKPIYNNLQKQLHNLHIPFVSSSSSSGGESADAETILSDTDFIIDALFGFSFNPPVRAPFDTLISAFETTKIPILSVDIPSSWDVEAGPPTNSSSSDGNGGDGPLVGAKFSPEYLISLTAPKPSVQHFRGPGKRHFVGGRFLPADVARKYGLDLPPYPGIDQIVEVDVEAKIEKL